MATLVTFHAHPDDEAIATGGTIAKAAASGHRVVLVVATRGERGEVPPGLLRPGETLAERRVAETQASARILGISRVEFLDHADSGMMGDPANDDPASFWQADIDEAGKRLAEILEQEGADALTIYDAHGTYGHPDHIKVHRVGVRAAALAGTRRVLEATANRDHVRRLLARARERGMAIPDGPAMAIDEFGVTEDEITVAIDVSAHLEAKRAAMAAHASQITETSIFLGLPSEAFAEAWGTEWFVRRDLARGRVLTEIFD